MTEKPSYAKEMFRGKPSFEPSPDYVSEAFAAIRRGEQATLTETEQESDK